MPSPETEPNGEDPDLLLHKPPSSTESEEEAPRGPTRWRNPRGWIIGAVIVLIPLLFTFAGAITSPPHVKSVPVGRLIYLEADQPSDHTTLLRSMQIMGPNGSSHQLLHEYEPENTDTGMREWITQPKASPDGKWLAFEKQIITIQEEEHSIINQIWVMPLSGADSRPRMMLDMTKEHLKQIVGLAWTRDSKSVVFLQDATAYYLPLNEHMPAVKQPLHLASDAKTTPDTSATRLPSMNAGGEIVYRTVTSGHASLAPYDISPDGHLTASLASPESDVIEIMKDKTETQPSEKVRWGWSVLGRRHINALRWSPDGKYLAYSVSKPPFEDELFYVNLATGKCFQLPVRAGQAGWDWAP